MMMVFHNLRFLELMSFTKLEKTCIWGMLRLWRALGRKGCRNKVCDARQAVLYLPHLNYMLIVD
jgi:hypothetical protein